MERESPDPGEIHVGKRVTRVRRGPVGDQSHQIQVKYRWGPESPDPVKPRWGPESLGPDEAQVRTRVTRYTLGPGGGQRQQVHVRPAWGPWSTGLLEAQCGTQ